jgi:nucleoside-diphosphate-sugar epimerase
MQLDPKLGILIVGAKGAVGSTVIAACLAAKAENNSAIFRLPTDGLDQANADFVDLQDMVIGGWDLNTETLAENLVSHGVVPEAVIKSLGTELDDVIFFDGILLEKNFELLERRTPVYPLKGGKPVIS